jgi:uncharacterized metal-binding protein
MLTKKKVPIPLVFSCSGCSRQAQLANDLALVMDREGYAEMSCILGVSGDVVELVELVHSGRPIMAIDGCHFACVKKALSLHNIEPTWHINLTTLDIEIDNNSSQCAFTNYAAMNRALRIIQALMQKPNGIQ